MRFTVKMLLTCILYCDAGPGCDQNCLQVKICPRSPCTFFFGDAVALLQVSYTFLWRHSYISCSYLIELMFLELDVQVSSVVLAPRDSNVAVCASLLTVLHVANACCICHCLVCLVTPK